VWATVLLSVSAALLMIGPAQADTPWPDELANSLSFYKDSYPGGDWGPYFDKLARIKDGVRRDDGQIVKVEMDQFIKMLRSRAHGISDVAADELTNYVQTIMPNETPHQVTTIELGTENERPMSVPQHTIQTPYQGGPPCKPGGCDYWADDVFDAGAQ
jgi:hypothetical protein